MNSICLDETVSIFEAAAMLGIAVPNLRSILRTRGLCPAWSLTGRVSIGCVQRLHRSLYPRLV